MILIHCTDYVLGPVVNINLILDNQLAQTLIEKVINYENEDELGEKVNQLKMT